jgi:hypothetical protein
LSNLIWLGFRAFALEIDALHYARLGENMMAAINSHPESFGLQQMAKLFKSDVGIGIAAQNFIEGFLGTHAGFKFSRQAWGILDE